MSRLAIIRNAIEENVRKKLNNDMYIMHGNMVTHNEMVDLLSSMVCEIDICVCKIRKVTVGVEDDKPENHTIVATTTEDNEIFVAKVNELHC